MTYNEELTAVTQLLEETRVIRLALARRRRAICKQLDNLVSEQTTRTRALRAAGLCVTCRKERGESPSTWKCLSCLDVTRQRARDATGSKEWQPGSKGRPPLPRPVAATPPTAPDGEGIPVNPLPR